MEVDRVAFAPVDCGCNLIAAPVTVLADVKRLVNVAGQVRDPHQRFYPAGERLAGIGEHLSPTIELHDNALPIGAGARQERSAHLNVYIVPGRRRAEARLVLAPHTVRPHGRVGERGDGASRRGEDVRRGDKAVDFAARGLGKAR